MKPRRLLAPRDAAEIFDRAVQDRALAVLTLQEGDAWATFKSRFLERDPQARFFVLDYEPVDEQPLPPLSPGQYVGVSFRHKSRKVLFATIVEAKGRFVLGDQSSVAAIRYRWPDTITELQRRAYYRTPVPAEMTIVANVWPGGILARAQAQNQTLSILSGTLADLSCGGAMIQLTQPGQVPGADNDLLGVEIHLPDGRPPVQLDARYRGPRSGDVGDTGVAVQFIGLELSPDGRIVLERLANCVQRLHRISIASGRRDWNGPPRDF